MTDPRTSPRKREQVETEAVMTLSQSRGGTGEKVLVLLERKDGTIIFRGYMTPDAFGRMVIGFSGQPVSGVTFEVTDGEP